MSGADAAEPDIAPVPDTFGHFPADGVAYGGRFAPEALMAALDELAAAYQQARNDPDFRARLDDLLRNYAGRPTLLTRARAVRRGGRRRDRPAQARGPHPHRVAQDQQRARPGPAGPADGQDEGHRRNRRRPARRRHGHRGRAVRPGVHGLHGRRGHPPAGPERVPHAHARRRGHPGHRRHPDAQGRHERGLPRLGDDGRVHPLLHRLGGRAAPVPDDGQGLPAGDRPGGQGAGPGRRPVACRTR